MKFLGILAIAIAASLFVSGCISSASLKNADCDGNCAECPDPCETACDGNSCGDCKSAGNCSGACESEGSCESEQKASTKSIFSATAEFANGSTYGGLENFEICTPSADRVVMDLVLTSHAVGCSSVGFGEIVVILLDESYNVIFRNIYTDDASESVELPASGGTYTMLVEGAGGGSGIKVLCDIDVWAVRPVSSGCGGCGGCPP